MVEKFSTIWATIRRLIKESVHIVTCIPVVGTRLGKHVPAEEYRGAIEHQFIGNGESESEMILCVRTGHVGPQPQVSSVGFQDINVLLTWMTKHSSATTQLAKRSDIPKQRLCKHVSTIEPKMFSVRSVRMLYKNSSNIETTNPVWRRGRIPPPWPCES
jgi:hypothetical protein